MKRTCTALLRRVASTRPTTCINRRGAASLQHRVLFNAEPAHAWRATFCTEAKAESTPAAEEAEAAAGGEGDAPAEKTPEDIIADLEAEVKELQDSRLRLLAEMENVRKIARNDVERAQKFAAKVRTSSSCRLDLFSSCVSFLLFRVLTVHMACDIRRSSPRACLTSRTTWTGPWSVYQKTPARTVTSCWSTSTRV